MLLWWLVTAFAAPCPDLGSEVDSGWAAYKDAELELAKEHLDLAAASLPCQPTPVTTEQLLRLYRLDAIVSITQSDQKGAVYATIRVVTIDPQAAPSSELGPQLAEMHSIWSERLAENVIRVAYQGDGDAWVDGRKVEAPWIEVYAGEHLFQFDGPDGWVSSLDEVDRSLTLGPAGAAPPPDPEPVVIAGPQSDGRRVRRTVLLVSGATVATSGVALLVGGTLGEARFAEDPYDAATYNGCGQAEACWEVERANVIRKDAGAIRLLYGLGYGALGLGGAIVGTELLLLPDPVNGGGSLHLSGRF